MLSDDRLDVHFPTFAKLALHVLAGFFTEQVLCVYGACPARHTTLALQFVHSRLVLTKVERVLEVTLLVIALPKHLASMIGGGGAATVIDKRTWVCGMQRVR